MSRLKADFRAGHDDLCQKPEEEEVGEIGDTASTSVPSLPDDFEMDVFCVSANDYLKLHNIKALSDGAASTFSDPADTQIPAMREFVRKLTAQRCTPFTMSIIDATSDLLDRVKLAVQVAYNSTADGDTLKKFFKGEMDGLFGKVKKVVNDFNMKAEEQVKTVLQPLIKAGARKGNTGAISTVKSWGSRNRRSCCCQTADKNGLHWRTYFATVCRAGVYTSPTVGEIDLNKELCDPMEKEYSVQWHQTMDAKMKSLLSDCEAKVLKLCDKSNNAVASGLRRKAGIADTAKFAAMVNAAGRGCVTELEQSFLSMKELTSESQRDINRLLLRLVKNQMRDGYDSCREVSRGSGFLPRMTKALVRHVEGLVSASMFDNASGEMLQKIDTMIGELSTDIGSTAESIKNTLHRVYSVCWEAQSADQIEKDPAVQAKLLKSRDEFLLCLSKLRNIQDSAMVEMGVQHREPHTEREVTTEACDSSDEVLRGEKESDKEAQGTKSPSEEHDSASSEEKDGSASSEEEEGSDSSEEDPEDSDWDSSKDE